MRCLSQEAGVVQDQEAVVVEAVVQAECAHLLMSHYPKALHTLLLLEAAGRKELPIPTQPPVMALTVKTVSFQPQPL
jgi:hypothetical protein